MFENDIDFDNNLELDINPKENVPIKRSSSPCQNEANKRPKITLNSISKNVVKRKFPGPAGLLPERKDFSFSEPQSDEITNDEVPCSQTSLTIFENSPWLDMRCDFETLLNEFNIKWIKNKARLNKLPNQKAPFLAALIQNIECCDEKNPSVNVLLKDPSGEIQGTLIHGLYEEYIRSLIVGAVVILKQFGVLTTGSNNNHHLTITQNNLVAIYVKEKSDNKLHNEVKIIKIKNVSCDDLIKNFNPTKKINCEKIQEENIFDDEFTLPDELEECLLKEHKKEEKKKFNFKKPNVVISCSQLSINTNADDSKIWENVLNGVDADSLFEDF